MNALLEYIMSTNIPPNSVTSVNITTGIDPTSFNPLSSGNIINGNSTSDLEFGGKPIMVKMEITEEIQMNMGVDGIKKQLAYKLVDEMIKGRLIEFTREPDRYGNSSTFRARAFLLSDSEVRTLRLEKLIK